MKFSYFCRKCGFNVLSNDKAEIKLAKQMHKARVITDLQGFKRVMPKCILVPVGDSGTVARPGLSHILEARRGYVG